MSSIIPQNKIAAFLAKKRGQPECDDYISAGLLAPIDDVRRETEKMKTWPGLCLKTRSASGVVVTTRRSVVR